MCKSTRALNWDTRPPNIISTGSQSVQDLLTDEGKKRRNISSLWPDAENGRRKCTWRRPWRHIIWWRHQYSSAAPRLSLIGSPSAVAFYWHLSLFLSRFIDIRVQNSLSFSRYLKYEIGSHSTLQIGLKNNL